jgi:hypothetical protein
MASNDEPTAAKFVRSYNVVSSSDSAETIRSAMLAVVAPLTAPWKQSPWASLPADAH